MIVMNRRSLITGLVSLMAAPAIVRAGSLMPVKLYDPSPKIEVLNPTYCTYYRTVIFNEDGLLQYGTPWRIR